MGRRRQRERQSELRISTGEIVQTPGHAFYDRLEEILRAHRRARTASMRASSTSAGATTGVMPKTFDPGRLVFIDESGATTNLARRYGRAPIGQRACGTQPAGHYAQLTTIGALSLRGFVAPMTIEGATDTDVIVAYVEHVFVPQLEAGQSVVFDSLSPHKAPRVRQLIEPAGCRLLSLPPYSPDFNPIEKAWSKIKQALRNAAARTREALEAAFLVALESITPSDAAGWFRHCGYTQAPN